MAKPFLSRQERFAVVGSTNDVVRGWLAEGTPEVCLAVADEQSSGRGREGRTWTAPRGAGLLLSLGFRPTWLRPEHTWRLAATISLAMAESAEDVAGVPAGTIQLKWPNDLVTESSGEWLAGASPSPSESERHDAIEGGNWLKLGGVLGETEGLGTDDPRAIVGIGVNADWARSEFPPELAASMTSLRELAGRRIAPATLLAAFLPRLEAGFGLLHTGRFEDAEWRARQATTGRRITLDYPDGRSEEIEAVGVDEDSGALLVDDGSGAESRRILSGEVRRVTTAAAQQRTTARV